MSPLLLEIVHHTGFDYAEPVTLSYNEARMTPVSDACQLVRRSRLHISPSVAQGRYLDYFGTDVTTFEVTEPHVRLSVEAISLVERRTPELSSGSVSHALDTRLGDRFLEDLTPTPRSTIHQDVVDAAAAGQSLGDVHHLAENLAEFVRHNVRYVPGATSVQSTATEAWERRAGVCQDMTHLMVAILRELGVPARYVSGYLYPSTTIEPGEAIAGESHAWVEYWCGAWAGIDPTNGLRETERHVVVARGRDYDDVPPIKGIYDGSGSTQLGVRVEMTARSL